MTQLRVLRRVEEDDLAGTAEVVAHELQHRAARRAERARVAVRGFDIVVARQRVEVVRVVAVHGCFVPHPLPRRMRVGVELDVERIPVDGGGRRHASATSLAPRSRRSYLSTLFDAFIGSASTDSTYRGTL